MEGIKKYRLLLLSCILIEDRHSSVENIGIHNITCGNKKLIGQFSNWAHSATILSFLIRHKKIDSNLLGTSRSVATGHTFVDFIETDTDSTNHISKKIKEWLKLRLGFNDIQIVFNDHGTMTTF